MTEPDLFQFFAGEFHEDWSLEAATADEVVEAFTTTHSQDERMRLAQRMDAFAAGIPDDQALAHALFNDLGCYYDPSADGQSARAWLERVAERLRAQR